MAASLISFHNVDTYKKLCVDWL